jgi:hypothetical protein
MEETPTFIHPDRYGSVRKGIVSCEGGCSNCNFVATETYRSILTQALSPEERKKAERFRFDGHKQRFIVRRGILRFILSLYLFTDPRLIEFCFGRQGKPMLETTLEDKSVRFNATDSNGVAVFAIAKQCEVGVDNEYMGHILNMDQIADRFMSRREKGLFLTCLCGKKSDFFQDQGPQGGSSQSNRGRLVETLSPCAFGGSLAFRLRVR